MKLDGKAGGILIETRGEPHVLIPLSLGGRHGDGSMRYTLVDRADYERLKDHKWQAHWNWTTQSFYAKTTIRRADGTRKTERLHRVLFGLSPGRIIQVDHRNHATLDNRRSNLRPATAAESGRNRKLRRDNRSGLKGVRRERNRWRARIRDREGRLITLGSFLTAESAAGAYDRAALRLHGDFARPNT